MKDRLTPSRDAREGVGLLLGIVALMWVVEALNSLDGNRLDRAGGLEPRDVDRLWAIFTSPFLHASFYPHLVDNTIPLLFMGLFIAVRGAARLALVTLIVIVVGGLGTWLVSPAHTITFGASGIVFGYATYLFARGLFNRSILEIIVGLGVGLVWGGALVSSVVPHAGVSWQGHICGAVGGVVAAWLLAAPHGHRSGAGTGSGTGTGSGSNGPGGAVAPGRAPLGGHDLHAALDRALES